jgi:hypothetical protein
LCKVVLEDEDDDTLAAIMGDDTIPPAGAGMERGIVERFDRWANIQMGDYSFCVSYIVPVAVYIKNKGCFISDKKWSQTTNRHIQKWIKHTGGSADAETQTMPQAEITTLFKQQAKTMRWTSKQAKKATKRGVSLLPTGGHEVDSAPTE